MMSYRTLWHALLFATLLHGWAGAWGQGLTVTPQNPVGTGTGSSAMVSSVIVDLRIGGSVMISTGTQFVVQFCDAAGTPVGLPQTLATNAAGVSGQGNRLTIPVPAGSTAMGNCVKISTPPDISGTDVSAAVQWRARNGIFGFFAGAPKVVVLPGPGAPGPQGWEIPIPPPGTGGDPVKIQFADGQLSTVVASHFDLGYFSSATGLPDVSDLRVIGNDSFLRLDTGDLLFYADQSDFGTFTQAPGAATGRFNFTALGLSGGWALDSLSGLVVATPDAARSFTGNELRVIPLPATSWLVATGLLVLWWAGRRANRRPMRTHSIFAVASQHGRVCEA